MSDLTRLYYEAHITIEPVFDEKLVQAQEMAKKHGFRVAELLMQKRKEDTPERSSMDTFMTGHSKSYHDIRTRTKRLFEELRDSGFDVWRAKIEDTLLDTKRGDEL